MGRNKPLTGRKRTLQLSGTRKVEAGSSLSGKGIYTQEVLQETESVPQASSEAQEPKPEGQSSEEKSVQNERLEDFIKVIHTLGSREDIEPPSSTTSEVEERTALSVMADTQATTSDVSQTQGSEAQPTFWHQVMDANSNHPYYWNPVTNEVSWTLPEGGVISYGGQPGGDEQNEPLDYFAYYDEGIVVPDRQGKGRGEVVGSADTVQNGEGEAKEKNTATEGVTASDESQQRSEVVSGTPSSVGGVKRKLEESDMEKGESQLMPTTVAPSSSQDSEETSPPKKMPRGALPRTVAKGVAEDKPRKPRSFAVAGSMKQEQQALRFQVSSLADELSRKLQFLHITIDGVSDMQILQVQVKTRLSDWQEGGLETKFLLAKLREASEHLLSYEIEAAPKGWRFLWDSTTCRYQFQHLSTGEITWEYPSSTNTAEDDEEVESESSREGGEEEEETAVIHKSPHPQAAIPPPPPPRQLRPHPQPLKPVKAVFTTSLADSGPNTTPQSMTSPTQTMTLSPNITMETKKPLTKSGALPTQVSRALVTSQMKQRSKSNFNPSDKPDKPAKDLSAPTAAFLGGVEMVPAPMPRAWKYENDALNRRVKREGSIERREDIDEDELSPSDVRKKLSKRAQPVFKTRQGRVSDVDLSEIPPAPVKDDSKKKKVVLPSVSPATCNQERGDIVKEALQALSNQTRAAAAAAETAGGEEVHSPPKNRDHGKRSETMATGTPRTEPSKEPSSVPTISPSVAVATTVAPSVATTTNTSPSVSMATSTTPSVAVVSGVESEAKMRERLIERAKRLRTASEVAQKEKQTVVHQSESDVTQSKDIEESTGLIYPQPQKKPKPSQSHGATPGNNTPSNSSMATKDTGGGRSLIKTGFAAAQIQISYDRVEPETGESENVAVVDETVSHVSGCGNQVGGLYDDVGEVSASSSEVKKSVSTSDEKPATTPLKVVVTEPVGSESVAPETSKQDTKRNERETARDSVDVGDVAMVTDTVKEGGVKPDKTEEDGEISSGSSTPGPVSESQTAIPPRCYMDQEQGPTLERGGRDQRDNMSGYGSNSPYDRQGKPSSRRQQSRSHSRSRSRDRYGDSRRSKHHHGDNSDYSDYEEEKRTRRSSDKHRRRGDDYSDYSGSEYSDGDRYSRGRRRDDYDSDEYRSRDRSSERRSRRSRDDERSSSRRHKRRSSRSRSRSKEPRPSSKHRHKDKPGVGSSGGSSSKKKKKEKREKKHKKDRKDDNDQPKPPKKVTVGRVGKVSSLRTLTSESGEGDTPLDKAQAAIAESIDEKQKQEKETMEKKEESKRLETRIQQHVQQGQGRSGSGGQAQAAQVVSGAYPAYPQSNLAQAGYYSGVYAGYQYPAYAAAGQNWAAAQWTGTGTDYQQYAQQQVAGMGAQQYGSVGSGAEQYASADTTATGTQQYGDMAESGNTAQNTETSGTGDQVQAIAVASESEKLQPREAETAVKPTNETVVGVSENVEGQHEGSGTEERPIEDMGMKESETRVRSGEQVESTDGVGKQQQHTETIAESTRPLDTAIFSKSTVSTATVPTTAVPVAKETEGKVVEKATGSNQPPPPNPPSSATGAKEVTQESDEIAECEMEIDSGGSSPVDTGPPVSLPAGIAVGSPMATGGGGAQGHGSVASTQQTSGGHDVDSGVMSPSGGCRDDEDGAESSPEPLPPGMEAELTGQIPQPPAIIPAQEGTKVAVSDTRAAAGGKVSDGGPQETGMETEEPVPPGMEPELAHSTTNTTITGSSSSLKQGEASSEVSDRQSETPPPPPPPIPVAMPTTPQPAVTKEIAVSTPAPSPAGVSSGVVATTTTSVVTTETGEVPAKSGVESAVNVSSGSVTMATSSVTSSSSQPKAVSSPALSVPSTPTSATTVATSAQGYDIAAAAKAYAHATKTGQPYQYPQQYAAQQQQQGYSDYAAYTAYLQQLSQYGGGYVLGADGQYYQQASPYGAYAAAAAAAGAYGGYYAAYSYASPMYQTTSQQVTMATTTQSTSEADKEKAKKGV